MATMTSIVRSGNGVEALRLREVERPELTDDCVLVRVRACSLNRADWYTVTGTPRLAQPLARLTGVRTAGVGSDFAGTVEAVGKDVAGVAPGDEVFGGRSGALAEYVCARSFTTKPASVTFEDAAAVPLAGLTALQALRDHGRLRAGETVLVNGASGGVGSFAVQIAKALGAAEVTAVCSTGKLEHARALGADHVIDYTREDFTRAPRRYDLVFDNAGSRSWWAMRRVLEPRGRVVIVGGPMGQWLGPLPHVVVTRLASIPGRRSSAFFIAKYNRDDLELLGGLLETGQLTPVVERTYPLAQAVDALRELGSGHARGKIVVTV